MQIIVCCHEEMKNQLRSTASSYDISVHYVTDLTKLSSTVKPDVLIDLLFVNSNERIKLLHQSSALVVVNSVTDTLVEINEAFVRINAWPGFFASQLIEASCLQPELVEKAATVFKGFGKELQWLPDEIGFIAPRVISMIINEAYFALADGVSTREDMNTAMKLGTAYPYGPFEWASLIGLDKIAALLSKLSATEPRYQPAPLLLREAADIKK